MKTHITRRTFLKQSSLVVATAALPGGLTFFNASPTRAGSDITFKPHAFVEIATDDTVTVWIGQTNLGQGTHTGIAMIVAEELDAEWDRVQAKMALAAEPFKDPTVPMQFTGGSTSIRNRWDMLRKVGAAARQLMLEAAAQQWGLAAADCKTDSGKVTHPDGRSLSYGQLVETARALPVPENPPLKDAKNYRIIGSSKQRMDIPAKVNGQPLFGIDVVRPNMLIASVVRPSRFGSKPESFSAREARAVKGVVEVIPLKDKIAVCADTTHAALKGRGKLNVKWSAGSHPDLNDEALDRLFKEHLEHSGVITKNTGDTQKALAEAAVVKEAAYNAPYIAHAQLEPINCTAQVEEKRCRIWVPTQFQTIAQQVAAQVSGLPTDKVDVMTTAAGGGFGVRGMPDPVVEAVLLSKILKRPVKVMWMREDDFANDYFRPAMACKVRGSLDENKKLAAWSQKIATPSIMSKFAPQFVQDGVDGTAVEGIRDMPYAVPNLYVEHVPVDLPIRIGFWRSVGHSFNTFTVETFMDEMALAAKKDPVEFRLAHMQKGSRPYRTLSLLAEKANWAGPLPTGRARGIAIGAYYGSSAGHMAEVSVDPKKGIITVYKIVCVIDCGQAVYPDAIVDQMQGGTIQALSVALHEKVHFADGGVKTSNYDQYPIMTMSEVPEIEVHIAKSRHAIGGVGELPVPTVAPALANAIFNSTGVRLKALPFKKELLIKG